MYEANRGGWGGGGVGAMHCGAAQSAAIGRGSGAMPLQGKV